MSTPVIRLRDVHKQYVTGPSIVRALHGVTADVSAGAFAAIVGRSGSGKSTLLHLLAAMDRPSAGHIEVAGCDVAALGRRAPARYRRETVGMVFQAFNLVPTMTALQNVELPLVLAGASPAERLRRAETRLDAVGLAHRLHHRPAELSGGEQQRVALARALVADPPVLLCDEPTGNLDSDTAREIVALLADVNRRQGRTVVVVTHDLDEVAAVTTDVLRLHDGRVIMRDGD
jgi:putative ABC transport system ATP-binding protein